MRRALLLSALLFAGSASAQAPGPGDAPARGPAEIIQRAGAARAAQNARTPLGSPANAAPAPNAAAPEALPPGHSDPGEMPPGHPTIAGSAQGEEPAEDAPIGGDPHAGAEGAPPIARRPIASAEANSTVPVGSVRVRVLDEHDHPVAGAEVQLGTMRQNNARTSLPGRTQADGTFSYEKLATGDAQAYRANVLYQGAKYSSTPFRLPADQGYEVTIRRLEVTHDSHEVVLYVGATSVELKDERLKVVQQARLINIGSKTYVFPNDGLLVGLPKDVLTFQADDVMTDQHIKEAKGEGMRITGSLPPGEATLTWGFDVPREETTADFTFELPWITFAYHVLADAAPGMSLDIDGFPPAELHEDNGRRFWVSEIVKRVGEQPLRTVRIHLKGIPGPGPLRFIAVALAVLVLGVGVFIALQPAQGKSAQSDVIPQLVRQRDQLLARAAELDAERARGEIGPEFHKTALGEIEEQLAAVLYEQERARRTPASARA
jgi:hypothetical protein